jgi:hypothetical protein
MALSGCETAYPKGGPAVHAEGFARPARGGIIRTLTVTIIVDREAAARLWKSFRGLAWDVFTFGLLGAFASGAIFSLGFVLFYDRDSVFGDASAALYAAGGMLCGWFAGAFYAARRGVESVVRSLYSLIDPLIQRVVRAAAAEGLTNLGSVIPMLRAERPGSFFGRLARWQLVRSITRHPLGEMLADLRTAQDGAVPIEQAIGERLIQVTTGDVRRRFQFLLWLACGVAVVLWSAPYWVPLLFTPR